MDLDRFVSVYNKEFVSYPLASKSELTSPKIEYEECTPRPIFYFTKPSSKCNWQSTTYVTSMPQKYPYIIEALKTDPPMDLLQINRDYYRALQQVGYCRMKRTTSEKVPKSLVDCYNMVCKPFFCSDTKEKETMKRNYDQIEKEKHLQPKPTTASKTTKKSPSHIEEHVEIEIQRTQPKPNALSGSSKDNLEPKVIRKYTESVAGEKFPPMDGVSEYIDTISKLGDRLLP